MGRKIIIKSIPKNKKVRNATPTEFDGIKFKSKLEAYCYLKLKENNLISQYEQTTFEILPAFIYKEEKVRKMTYTPDFVGENFIIECKGNMNDAFPLRWKIFKYYLFINKLNYDLYMPRSITQVDKIIKEILLKNG